MVAVKAIPNVQADDFFSITALEPYVIASLTPGGSTERCDSTNHKAPSSLTTSNLTYSWDKRTHMNVIQLSCTKEAYVLHLEIW